MFSEYIPQMRGSYTESNPSHSEDYGIMFGVGTELDSSRIGTLFGRADLVALGFTSNVS